MKLEYGIPYSGVEKVVCAKQLHEMVKVGEMPLNKFSDLSVNKNEMGM